MMTGPEHYRAAEQLLAASRPDSPDVRDTAILAAAQVHATLALTAATALQTLRDLADVRDMAADRTRRNEPRMTAKPRTTRTTEMTVYGDMTLDELATFTDACRADGWSGTATVTVRSTRPDRPGERTTTTLRVSETR